MTFNEMKARLQTILNRDDATDAQLTVFLQDGLARIMRDCKLPNMERSQITEATEPMDFIAIPPDLLQIIGVYVQNLPNRTIYQDKKLEVLQYDTLLRHSAQADPSHFARFQGTLMIRGTVPIGASVQLLYYGEFTPFLTGDSENEISASNPDLVTYAALSFAGDVYEHPSTDRWEARYSQILSQVQGLGADLDLNAGPAAMSPMYQD